MYHAFPIPHNQQCCSFSAANYQSMEMAQEQGVNKESAVPIRVRRKKEVIGVEEQVVGQG